MSENCQVIAKRINKKKIIAFFWAPLFFIYSLFAVLFVFDLFDLRSVFMHNSKEIFIRKTAKIFPLREVEIQGNQQISQEEIKDLFLDQNEKSLLGEHIFSFSLPILAEKLQNIEWIKRLAIQRRLPGKILINVEEKIPIFQWQISRSKNNYLVDENALIIKEFNNEKIENIPIVHNSFGQIEFLRDLLQSNSELYTQISEIRFADFWQITLPNDVDLYLTQEQMQNLSTILQRLDQKYHILQAQNEIDLLDLRNPHKIYIKKKKN